MDDLSQGEISLTMLHRLQKIAKNLDNPSDINGLENRYRELIFTFSNLKVVERARLFGARANHLTRLASVSRQSAFLSSVQIGFISFTALGTSSDRSVNVGPLWVALNFFSFLSLFLDTFSAFFCLLLANQLFKRLDACNSLKDEERSITYRIVDLINRLGDNIPGNHPDPGPDTNAAVGYGNQNQTGKSTGNVSGGNLDAGLDIEMAERLRTQNVSGPDTETRVSNVNIGADQTSTPHSKPDINLPAEVKEIDSKLGGFIKTLLHIEQRSLPDHPKKAEILVEATILLSILSFTLALTLFICGTQERLVWLTTLPVAAAFAIALIVNAYLSYFNGIILNAAHSREQLEVVVRERGLE
ncbi:hypothetical protein NMY22_g5440 [Coprinellus aureogranulatus]|nr:hypothetical protein NMY22_g5440 [Coprinellus aureogranulatus]